LGVDTFGSRLLSEVEQESGKKATLGRVRARGGQWETYVKSIRSSNGGSVSSEVQWDKVHFGWLYADLHPFF